MNSGYHSTSIYILHTVNIKRGLSSNNNGNLKFARNLFVLLFFFVVI